MTEETTNWTHETIRIPDPGRPARRLRSRTILIPLLFILIHFITVNMVSIAYLLIYLLLRSVSGSVDIMQVLGSTEALTKLVQEHYPVITILYSSFLIPVYYLYLRYARRKDFRALLAERTRISDLLPGLAMAVGALGLTNLYFSLLTKLAESSPFVAGQLEDYEKLSGSFTPETGLAFLIIGISVMAPVTEELLFRGIVQGELRKAMPEPVAIVLQAVLFAVYHIQPVQASYALIPGLLLGIAYAWSRSIWVPIAMHMGFNLLGSILPILAGKDEFINRVTVSAQVGFIAVGLVAGVFFYMNRRRGPIKSTDAGSMQDDTY